MKRKWDPFELGSLGAEGWAAEMAENYRNLKWTRLKSASQLQANKVVLHDLLDDILQDQTTRTMAVASKGTYGKVLFSLDKFEDGG